MNSLAALPVLAALLAAVLTFAAVFRWFRRSWPNAQDWATAAAVVGFFPVPFIVPFFAVSLVPVSYLALSGFLGAANNPQGMMIPAGVSAAVLAAASVPLTKLLARTRWGRIRFAVVLAAASLLPIYAFNLEQLEFENVISLISDGHHWGQ